MEGSWDGGSVDGADTPIFPGPGALATLSIMTPQLASTPNNQPQWLAHHQW